MYNGTLQKEIIDIERELLNIKQVQGKVKNVPGYTYEFGDAVARKTYKITYKKSDSPLISLFMGNIFEPTPLKVVDNYQYFTPGWVGGDVLILSTWEVQSIELVN